MASKRDSKPANSPPLPPLFNVTAETLLADTHSLVNRAREVQDNIVATVKAKAATFGNTLLPLIHEENARLYERQQIEFFAEVSKDAATREASRKASSLFRNSDADTSGRQDLYDLISAVRDSGEKLDPEPERWPTKYLSSSERNGLALSIDARARLKVVNSDLAKLEQEYLNCCGKDAELWCSREELAGVDAGLLDGLEVGKGLHEGELRLCLDSSLVHNIQQHAHSSATRRLVYETSAQACAANVHLLREAIILRLKKAELLGHTSYSSLQMAGRMAPDPAKMKRFLEELVDGLAPARDSFVSTWRKMKKADVEARNEQDDGKFYSWDPITTPRSYWLGITALTGRLSASTSRSTRR